MKALIVYYSLTGTTHKLAERMAGMLKCDVKRLPMFGGSVSIDENQYDLVIVGTPIWLYHPSFPVSRFLSKNRKDAARCRVLLHVPDDYREKLR